MLMCYAVYLTSLDLSKEKILIGVERTANTERCQPKMPRSRSTRFNTLKFQMRETKKVKKNEPHPELN